MINKNISRVGLDSGPIGNFYYETDGPQFYEPYLSHPQPNRPGPCKVVGLRHALAQFYSINLVTFRPTQETKLPTHRERVKRRGDKREDIGERGVP